MLLLQELPAPQSHLEPVSESQLTNSLKIILNSGLTDPEMGNSKEFSVPQQLIRIRSIKSENVHIQLSACFGNK